ncbi:protease SohB [Pseudomonas guariconensis]|uniref:protease SohB n=1 Tax=Pseudomonas guariconensis TaxID=1288410 RepID=UPI003906608D
MQFFYEYLGFLSKAVTFLAVFFVMVGIVFSKRGGGKTSPNEGKLRARLLNKFYASITSAVEEVTLSKAERKVAAVAQKQAAKQAKVTGDRQKVFVLDFKGDLAASAVESLRHEVTAVLAGAKEGRDEVVVRLESPGGYVPPYGLASSQLQRIKDAGIPLTVCVDQIAASGGYMMACIGDKIVAAPFAVLGSVGVVAEVPNVNRLLKKLDIDYDVVTAGESKRTVTVFGENTDEGREKFKEQLHKVYDLFKTHVQTHRPQVNIEQIATGESWHAQEAIKYKLVDELKTSDEYLAARAKSADLIQLEFVRPKKKQSILKRLIAGAAAELLDEHGKGIAALLTKPH